MKILEYKGYFGDVEYSEEDKCYVGFVLDIRSLIIYEGETVEELEADFRDGIDCYLESCEMRNKEPEKPTKPKEFYFEK